VPASVRLQLASAIDVAAVADALLGALNPPGWPLVEVFASGDHVAFAADTWEPLLRARVEEALEQVLGNPWRDLAQWL
jgi:hypothetical protein